MTNEINLLHEVRLSTDFNMPSSQVHAQGCGTAGPGAREMTACALHIYVCEPHEHDKDRIVFFDLVLLGGHGCVPCQR